MAEENTFQLSGVGGLANRVVGPAVASTTTIAPAYLVNPLTGTTTVATISLPHTAFNGILILIPDSQIVLAGGNIATTTTLTTSVPALLAYVPSAAKWYVK